MEHRKLSEEEASRLFEATFLLLSQQNTAQKQRNLKTRHSPPSPSAHFPPLSPPKLHPSLTAPRSPQPRLLPRPANPQNSPGVTRTDMNKKSSMEKSSSNSEGRGPEGRCRGEAEWREEDSDHGSSPAASQSTPHGIATEVPAGRMEKGCQMEEQAHEGLFAESMIKEAKRDIEIRSRGKICKSQIVNSKTGQVTGYNFYCKVDPHCPFSCTLIYTGHHNSKHEKLYKMVSECDAHAKGCIESEQEIAFMRLTKTIDDLEPAIAALLAKDSELKPKDILSVMAEQQGEDSPRFIYRGLASKNYHKAAKKYFDNMIYKIKSQMGVL